MSRNGDTFIPMSGPVSDIFDVLCELIEPECNHPDTKKHTASECDQIGLYGLEEAAVRLGEMLERGELL